MGIKSDQMIVVVESGSEDLSILVEGLQLTGVRNPIKHLGSGNEALDYLLNRGVWCDSAVASPPALILLDLHLADMDGQRFLSMLRHPLLLKTIPIIVFTHSAIQEQATECYALGANSCMQKPQSPNQCVPILPCLIEYWSQVIVAPQAEVN